MNSRFLMVNSLVLFGFMVMSLNGAGNFKIANDNIVAVDFNEVNAQNLKQACIYGSFVDIKKLAEEGVDIRMNNDMAIKTAIDYNHTILVKSLYISGCNSMKVIDHMLMTASKNENEELVKFALKTEKCSKGLNSFAIGEAVRFGHLNIVEMIFENGAETEVNGYLVTVAKLKGFTDIIEYLAGKGIKVDTNYDDEALRWASGLGHLDIIELLLGKGANIHANDDDALHTACFNGNTEVVKFLLENVSIDSRSIGSLLDLARRNGCTGVVKLLSNHKASRT